MVNRYIQMRPDWIDYHDPFWRLSEQGMSSLNVLAFLIYSQNVPVPQFTHPRSQARIEEIENYLKIYFASSKPFFGLFGPC